MNTIFLSHLIIKLLSKTVIDYLVLKENKQLAQIKKTWKWKKFCKQFEFNERYENGEKHVPTEVDSF